MDTLRADHLGVYGYALPVCPHLDAFAREATVYRGIAQSSWTKSSVASLLTGRCPLGHRAQTRGDTLPSDTTTLSKILSGAGYRTFALYANTWVSETFGLDQGFEDRRFVIAPSERLNRELFAWLEGVHGDERLFAYVHTIDPHAPYSPPDAFRIPFRPEPGSLRKASIALFVDLASRTARGESIPRSVLRDLTALYDGEIASNDEQFGRFLDELKRRDLYEDSLIVFTSDHGEEFLEHGGLSHGRTLHAEVLEVPFIVKWPRGVEAPSAGGGSLAQHIDLVPTILDVLGLPVPPGVEGTSLLASRGDGPIGERPAFSYLDLDGIKEQSVTTGSWKLIRRGAEGGPQGPRELYSKEGAETANVADQHPILTAYLTSLLSAHARQHPREPPPRQGVLSDELKERLRALGYMR